MRISDWSSDVCSSDLADAAVEKRNSEASSDASRKCHWRKVGTPSIALESTNEPPFCQRITDSPPKTLNIVSEIRTFEKRRARPVAHGAVNCVNHQTSR